MTSHQIGLSLVAVGLVLVIAGLLIWCGGLPWFGHLPGDIRIEKETTKVFIPITSMLLVSIVISLLVYLIRRLF